MKQKPVSVGDDCYVIDSKGLIRDDKVTDVIYSEKNDDWTIVAKGQSNDVFVKLDDAIAVRERRLVVDKVAKLLYRRPDLMSKFTGRKQNASYGGVQVLKKYMGPDFDKKSFDELRRFYEANKRKPWTVYTLQKMIDRQHRHSLWYGGRVAEVKHKGYTFILGAYGDVRATLLDGNNDIVAEVRDKYNQGRFYEEMHGYVRDDKHLLQLLNGKLNELLVLENNNWWEILIDDPEGYQHDLGWVTCSDMYDEALHELIDNMDDVIADIEGGSRNAL